MAAVADSVARFMDITGAEAAYAITLLSEHGGDLDLSLASHFAMQEAAEGGGGGGSGGGHSGFGSGGGSSGGGGRRGSSGGGGRGGGGGGMASPHAPAPNDAIPPGEDFWSVAPFDSVVERAAAAVPRARRSAAPARFGPFGSELSAASAAAAAASAGGGGGGGDDLTVAEVAMAAVMRGEDAEVAAAAAGGVGGVGGGVGEPRVRAPIPSVVDRLIDAPPPPWAALAGLGGGDLGHLGGWGGGGGLGGSPFPVAPPPASPFVAGTCVRGRGLGSAACCG